MKLRVKAWLEKERCLCHHVDKTDLVEEFLVELVEEVEERKKKLKMKFKKLK